MKKRFSTKLLSTVLSVAIAAMGTLVCPLSASAAADDDQIVVPIYIDSLSNRTQFGEGWGPEREGWGYSSVWAWQIFNDHKSTDSVDGVTVKPGGSGSDQVFSVGFNLYYKADGTVIPENGKTDGAVFGGVPSGDPLTVLGQVFRTSGWPIKAHNISEYVDTGMVSMKIRLDDEAFIENAHLVLFTSIGSEQVGIPISDQYTVADAGKWKQINVPLSAFVNPGSDAIVTGAGLDPSTFVGGGLGFTNASELTARTFIYYDDFYICNVPKPRNLTIDSATDTEVNLSWDTPLGVATKYEILRTDEEGNTETLDVVDSSVTSYTDRTVELLKTYTYAVRTINSVGAASINSNTVEAYISNVGAPKNFTAESGFGGDLKVELAWEEPTYPLELAGLTYNVYRQKLGEDTPELIAEDLEETTVFTDTTDTGMVNNTEYTYYVCSYLNGEESMPSTKITLAAAYIDIPENLIGTYSVEDKSITLTWDAVDNAESYNVYRDDEKIANVDTLTYTDEGLEYSYNYRYEVTAVYGERESVPSNSVIEIIPDPAIDSSNQTIVFNERTQNGYSAGAFGGSTAGISDENFVMGELSYKISFATGTQTVNGASFKKAGVDMTSLRENGGLLSFYVYGASKETLNGVKVGFECTVSSKTVRTAVDLDDYIGGRYGRWVFVQIPMSDFAAKGTYNGVGTTSGSANFNYAAVNALVFYTDEIHAQLDKSIYLDDVMFTQYVTPELTGVTYGEGTAITAGSTVASDTAITTIKVAFDKEMDADSVTDTTVVLEEAGVKKTVVAECDGNVITLTIPSGLKSGKAYTLKLNGVKSMERGVIVTDFAFNTATVAEVPAITFPADAEGAMAVTVPSSVKKGETATVKVTIANGVAREATVNGGKITIDFTSTVLTAYDTDITISSVLKNAGADVKRDLGKITITLPEDAELILGDTVATIKFRTSATGKATVTANAELTDTVGTKLVLDKAEESFTVKNGTPGQGQVSNGVVSDTSNIGGGRDTTPVKDPITVTDTETNAGDKDSVFSDVKVDNWAKKHIEYLYEIKYISGYDDGTFRPDQSVSREEFLKMLLNAAAVDTTDATTTFGDITADDWCYSVVAAAERDGIINGDNGNFGKGRSITREDMCTMVARAAEKYNINIKTQYSADLFDDYNNISDYAQDSVTKLQTAGIINGMGDGTFAPKGEVTRAMAAKVIYEIVQLIVKG